MSCKDFGLPEPHKFEIKELDECDVEVINYCKQKFNNMYHNLNVDQKYIFEQIISQKTRIHFIDGPGGSGKTFVYKTLIHYVISIKKKFINGLDRYSFNSATQRNNESPNISFTVRFK